MSGMIDDLNFNEKPPRYHSWRDWAAVFFRHKHKALVFFAASCLVFIWAASSQRDFYTSEGKLLVRMGWESMNVDPTATTTGGGGDARQPLSVMLNSVLDILKSRALAEEVVDRIGPAQFGIDPGTGEAASWTPEDDDGRVGPSKIGPRDKAVDLVMNSMEAGVLPNTQIISIRYTSTDPALAREIVKIFTDLCIEKHKIVYRTPGSYQFLEEQERTARKQIDRIEAEMKALVDVSGSSSTRSRLEAVDQQIARLEMEIDGNEIELNVACSMTEDLKGRLETLPETHRTGETTTLDYSVINQLRQSLYELKSEEQTLLSRYTEETDAVREVRRRIAEVEAQLAVEKPREIRTESWTLNEARMECAAALSAGESQLKSLEIRSRDLKAQLERSREERDRLLNLVYRASRFEKELERHEAGYSVIREKLSQARMEQALEEKRISNLSIVLPATYPIHPEESKRAKLLLGGFFAALLGAVFITFLFDFLDHSLKTPEEVEKRIKLPILASIPRAKVNVFTYKRERL